MSDVRPEVAGKPFGDADLYALCERIVGELPRMASWLPGQQMEALVSLVAGWRDALPVPTGVRELQGQLEAEASERVQLLCLLKRARVGDADAIMSLDAVVAKFAGRA
jgi:hypothetical protein